MTTIIKLGGSLITDKRVERHFRVNVMARLAAEIAAALGQQPDLRLIIGHGSGSFGHVAAKQHGTAQGVSTPQGWRGFAEVATIAAELNQLVAQSLHAAGVPAWRIQPSASVRCVDGIITAMALHPIETALAQGIVPLVYGDVALDDLRGGTIISTETIITYLADHLPIERVLLLGEVPGVLDTQGAVIPHITPRNIHDYQAALGGSAGTDVTGGMETKVGDMLALASKHPGMTVHIIDGRQDGLLTSALLTAELIGTKITA